MRIGARSAAVGSAVVGIGSGSASGNGVASATASAVTPGRRLTTARVWPGLLQSKSPRLVSKTVGELGRPSSRMRFGWYPAPLLKSTCATTERGVWLVTSLVTS